MNKEQRDRILGYLMIIVSAGMMYLFVLNFSNIMAFLGKLIGAVQPLLVGIFLALILNIPMKRIEEKLDASERRKGKKNRALALTITFTIFVLLVAIISVIVVPQLTQSLATLAGNMSRYAVTIAELLNGLLERIGIDYRIPLSDMSDLGTQIIKLVNEYFEKIRNIISDFVPGFIGDITTVIGSFISEVFSVFMAFVFSAHILLKKERLLKQINMLLEAYLKHEWVEKIRYVCAKANEIFGDFIGGQLVEMGILGGIFFVAMLIFRMPYAFLISCIIAITSIIPYFGAAVGILFGAILILAEKGFFTMLFFIVVFEALQQIENNFIYPKVVGNSVGLEPIWVLFALLFFGKLFGLLGMVASAPIMALIYTLISEAVHERLSKKEEYTSEIKNDMIRK